MQSATLKETVHGKKHANHREADVHPFQQAHDEAETVMHSVGQQVRDFVENAGENISNAKESVTDMTDHVAKQIKKNPIPASAIALGVGMLLGSIFLSRK
jgi:ElaB/YqjD/DUF883 family membrane-anchored ribosome-binding protein